MDNQEKAFDIIVENPYKEFEGNYSDHENMLFTAGRKTESLNGIWHYAVDQYDTCIRSHWFEEKYYDEDGSMFPVDYSFDEWPVMNLPCSWNMQEERLFLYEGPMVFTRKFTFQKNEAEKVFLRIGAANYLCRVFLNGRYVGAHKGGSTPMFIEISDYLAENNRIVIVADSTRRAEQVPAENTDWFNYGGVYRDIDLIRTPAKYIKDFRLSLVNDEKRNKLYAEVVMSEETDDTATLRIEELNVEKNISIVHGSGSVTFEASPELWSPERPKLYSVTLSTAADTVSDVIGFRTISVQGTDILLNGKKIFLRGINCHEDSVKNGKAVTEEECEATILTAKELGCNFMRLAHYPHTEAMSKLADRLGIMLWEEIPVYWAIRFGNPQAFADARNQLLELIKRDFNRASVIIWSVGNENLDSEERLQFMTGLADAAHQEDATRPVTAACLVSAEKNAIADRLVNHLDIVGVNEYCGWNTPFSRLEALFANSKMTKPVIVSEFGADAMSGHHGTLSDKGTEEFQASIYKKQVDVIKNVPYVQGMTPWILFDYRSPRRTSILQQYFNRKGLIAEDRKTRKLAFAVLQKFYRECAQKQL